MQIVVEVQPDKSSALEQWMLQLCNLDKAFKRKRSETFNDFTNAPSEGGSNDGTATTNGETKNTEADDINDKRFIHLDIEHIRRFNSTDKQSIASTLIRRLKGVEFGIAYCGLIAWPGESEHLVGWHIASIEDGGTNSLPYLVKKDASKPFGYDAIEPHLKCCCKFPIGFVRSDEPSNNETTIQKNDRKQRNASLDAVETVLQALVDDGKYPARQDAMEEDGITLPDVIQALTVEDTQIENVGNNESDTSNNNPSTTTTTTPTPTSNLKSKCVCNGMSCKQNASSVDPTKSMYNYSVTCTKAALVKLINQINQSIGVDGNLASLNNDNLKLEVDRANTFAATPGGSVNKTRTWIQTLLRLVRLQQLKLDNL